CLSFAPSSAPDAAARRDLRLANPVNKRAPTIPVKSLATIECTINNIHLQIAAVMIRQLVIPSFAFGGWIKEASLRFLLATNPSPVTHEQLQPFGGVKKTMQVSSEDATISANRAIVMDVVITQTLQVKERLSSAPK